MDTQIPIKVLISSGFVFKLDNGTLQLGLCLCLAVHLGHPNLSSGFSTSPVWLT